MAGFFDYILGREEYAPDAPIDPNTGLRPADQRQAALQALGNFSAILSQVGASRTPAEAARAWSAMPAAVGASQEYLKELGKERRVLQQEQGLRNLMKDPEQLRGLGITEQQMALLKVLPTAEAAKVFGQVAFRDQTAKKKAELELAAEQEKAATRKKFIEAIVNNPNYSQAQKDALVAGIGTADLGKQLFPQPTKVEYTNIEKLIQARDRQRLGSRERETIQAAIDKEIGKNIPIDPKERAAQENTIRDDLKAELKPYNIVNEAWTNIKALAVGKTGFSDTALIVSFVKVLDPESVVREGEVRAAENNMGFLVQRFGKQIQNAYEGTGVLTPQMRQNLLNAAASLYEGKRQAANIVVKNAEATANRMNLDFQNILWSARPSDDKTDIPDVVTPRITADDAGQAAYKALPRGAVYFDPNGIKRKKP
jgi:hypothetical protein